MTHAKTRAINLLTIILTFMVALFVVTTVMYFYPRKTVEPTTTQTDKNAYRIGDVIRVSGKVQAFMNGHQDNFATLQCGVASYSIVRISLPLTKTDGVMPYDFIVGQVPDGVMASPPRCRVVTYSTIHYRYFLWLERHYDVVYTSNEFDIIK